NDLMMTSDQVRLLHSAGMEIGGHTVNHPILAKLDSKIAMEEIASNREILVNTIHAPVQAFAYPNGKPRQDYLQEHVRMVKKLGFETAVSTQWGVAGLNSDLFQLPRFTPWDKNQMGCTLRMAQNIIRNGI